MSRPLEEAQEVFEGLESEINRLDAFVGENPDHVNVMAQLKEAYLSEYEAGITFLDDCALNIQTRIGQARRQIEEGAVGASRKRASVVRASSSGRKFEVDVEGISTRNDSFAERLGKMTLNELAELIEQDYGDSLDSGNSNAYITVKIYPHWITKDGSTR
jgi:hypothetical protein